MPLTPLQRDLITLNNYKTIQAVYSPGSMQHLEGPAVVFVKGEVYSIIHATESVTLRDGIFVTYIPLELHPKRHRRGKHHAMRLESPSLEPLP